MASLGSPTGAAGEPSWPAEEERYSYILRVLLHRHPPPASVLELGAAPGVLSVKLARAGYDVTAVDLGDASDAWGVQAEGTMAASFARAGVRLVVHDLEVLPYPADDASFDVVLLTEVLEHLRDYPARVIVEARRIIKREGYLVVTTPNAASLQRRMQLAIGRSVYSSLDDWLFGAPHARHAREYTAGELVTVLQHAGFRPVSLEGRHFHLRSGRRNVPARVLKKGSDLAARIRPSLGPNLAVVARRLD